MPVNTSTTAHASTMEVEDGILDLPTTLGANIASSDSTAWWKRNRSNKILSVVALVALSVALGLTLSRREVKVDRDTTPSQIIGGSEAVPDRYPYMVSFQTWGQHYCGGSLITKDIVLTAAHCFPNGIPSTFTAVVGSHDFSVDVGESIPVIKGIPHPTYNLVAANDNDFMLVFLETEFTASNVGLVKLNPDESIPCVDQDLTSMGWGDTDVNICRYRDSPQLKYTNLKVMPNEQCNGAEVFFNGTSLNLGPITDNMLCSTRTYQEDTCQGDSGGPVVIKGSDAASDVQVGVVSFGIYCAIGSPGVYSRVSKAYDWIANEVCAYDLLKAEMAGFDCALASTWAPTASPITLAPTFTPAPTQQVQCDSFTTCAAIGLEGMCCSQWGFCGNTEEHCSEVCCVNGCQAGVPPTLPPSISFEQLIQSTSPPSNFGITLQQSVALNVPSTSPLITFSTTFRPSTFPPHVTPAPTYATASSSSTLPPWMHNTPFPTNPPTTNMTGTLPPAAIR